MNKMRRAAKWLSLITALVAILASHFALQPAMASEFALSASPPRFELRVKPGERSRQVLELTNASNAASSYSIKTADWIYADDNSVTFQEALSPQSCRSWVAIERRELTIAGGKAYRYRFEVNIPTDAKAGECRFALMLEGQEQISQTVGGPPIPFSARLGVVVYVAVGDAEPELSVVGKRVTMLNGLQTPALQVRNAGLAHGRVAGFFTGTDAGKTLLEFAPSNLPILPGETRWVPLTATRPGDSETAVQAKYPLTISGKAEWGRGKTQAIEQRFEAGPP